LWDLDLLWWWWWWQEINVKGGQSGGASRRVRGRKGYWGVKRKRVDFLWGWTCSKYNVHMYGITQLFLKRTYWFLNGIVVENYNNKCWPGCRGKGTLIRCWWECKLVQPLWKSVWRFLKKTKSRITTWSCYTSAAYIPEGMEVSMQ
jgi:hypothetical protein